MKRRRTSHSLTGVSQLGYIDVSYERVDLRIKRREERWHVLDHKMNMCTDCEGPIMKTETVS
jgi:hypothetical protein